MTGKRCLTVLLVAALLAAVPGVSRGFTDICAKPGEKKDPAVVRTASDDFIIVWMDGRDYFPWPYAQKLSGDLKPQWREDGVRLPVGRQVMNAPQRLEPNRVGGAIRYNDTGIELTPSHSINAAGEMDWEGLAAGAGISLEFAQDIGGGLYRLWTDPDLPLSGKGIAVSLASHDKQGRLAWNEPVTVIGDDMKTHGARLSAVDSGGAVVAWTDSRESIRAQRFDAGGKRLWGEDGVTVGGDAPGRGKCVFAGGRGADETLLVWGRLKDREDFSGEMSVYAQALDAQGNGLWGKEGVAAAKISGRAYFRDFDITAASDSAGGVLVVWAEEDAIRAQRVNAAGALQWPQEGATVAKVYNIGARLKVFPDGLGGAVVAWKSKSGKSASVLSAQRLTKEGTIAWKTEGLTLGDEGMADIAPDGRGGAVAVVASEDSKASGQSGKRSVLWVCRIGPDGEMR